MQILKGWLSTLAREDDLLVGQWEISFAGQRVRVEVSFKTPTDQPTTGQVGTFSTYLERQEELHTQALAAIFVRYQTMVERYRTAFGEWGEDPDALAPLVSNPSDLIPLLEIQSVYVPPGGAGAFGLGFWSRWEQEHGAGVRFVNWKVEEAGDCEVHFCFDEAAN